MKTILLTGATGYLGGYLSENFLNKGYKIIALALNRKEQYKYQNNKKAKVYYLDETSISQIFDNENVDIVIHTATLYGRNQEQLIMMEKVNVEFPLTVLEEAIKHEVKMFVNTSTILAKNLNPYALTKNHFEDWLSLYSDKIKCINLKLDHFYGPNDKPIKFIAWIIQQLKNNVDHIDLTEGSQTRDFIYIDDVVSAFNTVIDNEEKIPIGKLNTFEVGTGNKTSIKELVLIIQKEMNKQEITLNFGAIPYRKNEVLDYELNLSGLHLLGYKPEYLSIQKGIHKLLEEQGSCNE